MNSRLSTSLFLIICLYTLNGTAMVYEVKWYPLKLIILTVMV